MSSAPVTEICYINLKPGLDIEGDTPARKVLRGFFKTVSEQDGFERLYYGKQCELFSMGIRPSVVVMRWAAACGI